jgi:hypothetical protein
MTTFIFFWGLETRVGVRNMMTADLLEGLVNTAWAGDYYFEAMDILEGRA